MEIGVVLQTTPPAARVIDLAKRAETYGFSHVWTFDSHILWEEPYVIYSKILDETRNIIVGPMVTNPATRDWTVTASTYATLNEMYGNRTICGIGRGDRVILCGDNDGAFTVERDHVQSIRINRQSSETEVRGAVTDDGDLLTLIRGKDGEGNLRMTLSPDSGPLGDGHPWRERDRECGAVIHAEALSLSCCGGALANRFSQANAADTLAR